MKAFQVELGVEPTGTVDAATITAFQKALADLQQPDPAPSAEPSSEPTETPYAVAVGPGVCRSAAVGASWARLPHPVRPHKPLGARAGSA